MSVGFLYIVLSNWPISLMFSKNKGVIPTSCLRMLMDVGVDLDFIELFGLLLKLSYVTFAIAFLMSLLVVLFCWQLCQLLIISLNPT